jgi:hypothetical protein
MISPRVLEGRKSGKSLSDSVTEQSDDSSVIQDNPTPSMLLSLYIPSILRRWKKGYSKFIYGPRTQKGGGVVTIIKIIGKYKNDYKEPTLFSS